MMVQTAGTLPNADNEEHLNINVPNEVSDETVEAFLRDHDYNPYIDAENPLPTPSTQEAPIPNAGTPNPVDNAGEGPSGYNDLSTTSKWRARYRFNSEIDPDLAAESVGDTLGQIPFKIFFESWA